MSKKQTDVADKKLLSRIMPEDSWGACQGFWASTFELGADFFETDFLPHLFQLGAWDDKAWTSRIALETKLSELHGSSIIIDAHAYRERPRSMRLDVLPGKGPNGNRLHAKVMLIVHEHAVRLLVGSSNLTSQGYRGNIEIAASIVSTDRNPASRQLLEEALDGARGHFAPWWTETVQNITGRAMSILETLPIAPERDTWFAWSGGDVPLWESYLQKWPRDERIRRLTVVSPFWSSSIATNPLIQFLAALKRRGLLGSGVEVHLIAEAAPIAEGKWLPVLPDSYKMLPYEEYGVKCVAHHIDPRVQREEVDRDDLLLTRKLHAKAVLMEGDIHSLMYAGSANFTHQGWGFVLPANRANIEAGLLMLRNGKDREALRQQLPRLAGDPILLDGSGTVSFSSPETNSEGVAWPLFLKDLRLHPTADDDRKLELHVVLDTTAINEEWQLSFIEEGEKNLSPLLNYAAAYRHESDTIIKALTTDQVNRLMLDQEMEVSWGTNAPVRFPVNVSTAARDLLPISPDSTRPTEGMLLEYYQGRISYEELFPQPDVEKQVEKSEQLDSTSGVDTSNIQSYKIREFVESLDGLRDDLARAAQSERTMRLALLGPISPVSLAKLVMDAIAVNMRTPVAGAFQIAEILSCIQELRTHDLYDSWKTHHIRAHRELEELLATIMKSHPTELGKGTGFHSYFSTVVLESIGEE